MVESTLIKQDYSAQLLQSDVFQHVVSMLDNESRLEARKLSKKIANSTVNNMFTDCHQGRLKIDMDCPHSEESHPLFLRMKNMAMLQLDYIDLSPTQLQTLNYLGKCFGASVRHLKLSFDGPTEEALANTKKWHEAFYQFKTVETLSLTVHSG